jgi:hypothetical protein
VAHLDGVIAVRSRAPLHQAVALQEKGSSLICIFTTKTYFFIISPKIPTHINNVIVALYKNTFVMYTESYTLAGIETGSFVPEAIEVAHFPPREANRRFAGS